MTTELCATYTGRMDITALVSPEKLKDFCRSRRIAELAIFGSTSRGDAGSDSDIDVLVQFMPHTAMSLLDFAGIQEDLADLFQRPVDLVAKDHIRNPFRRRSILRDATTIYAA